MEYRARSPKHLWLLGDAWTTSVDGPKRLPRLVASGPNLVWKWAVTAGSDCSADIRDCSMSWWKDKTVKLDSHGGCIRATILCMYHMTAVSQRSRNRIDKRDGE